MASRPASFFRLPASRNSYKIHAKRRKAEAYGHASHPWGGVQHSAPAARTTCATPMPVAPCVLRGCPPQPRCLLPGPTRAGPAVRRSFRRRPAVPMSNRHEACSGCIMHFSLIDPLRMNPLVANTPRVPTRRSAHCLPAAARPGRHRALPGSTVFLLVHPLTGARVAIHRLPWPPIRSWQRAAARITQAFFIPTARRSSREEVAMTDPGSPPVPPTVDTLRTRDGHCAARAECVRAGHPADDPVLRRHAADAVAARFLSPVHDARVARCTA